MDAIRNRGTVRPRDTQPSSEDFGSHGAGQRSVRPRTAGPLDTAGPLSPRGAACGHMAPGASSLPPRTAPPLLRRTHPHATMSGSVPQEGPSRAPPGGPSALSLAPNPVPLLAAFGVSARPMPADLFRLLDIAAQHPGLEGDIASAADQLLPLLQVTPQLLDGVESRYGRSEAANRIIERLLGSLLAFGPMNLDLDLDLDLDDDVSPAPQPGAASPSSLRLSSSPPNSPNAVGPTNGPPDPARALLQDVERLSNLSGAALMAEFGIHGRPEPSDLFRLLDMDPQSVGQASILGNAAEEVIKLLDITDELRAAVESRLGRGEFSDQLTEDVLEQIEERAPTAITDLEDDLARQQASLGDEIQAWAHLTGERNLESFSNDFNDEAYASSFARVLARLKEGGKQGSSATREETAAQVLSVLNAIQDDAELRAQVFTIAKDALGSCGDNLDEGFSNIRLAVDNHLMARAVDSGQVDARQLNGWAQSLFHLSLLETEVQHFMQTQLKRPDLPDHLKEAFEHEPLEVKLHAKVALAESLGLPPSTASKMQYSRISGLQQADLDRLEQQVKTRSKDPAERHAFLLNHPTWRAGIKALHPKPFQELGVERDGDPFYERPLPEGAAERNAYNEDAKRFQAKWNDRENQLMLELAGEGGQASGK